MTLTINTILVEPDKEGRRVVRERIMKWKHEEDHYYSSEERERENNTIRYCMTKQRPTTYYSVLLQ